MRKKIFKLECVKLFFYFFIFWEDDLIGEIEF